MLTRRRSMREAGGVFFIVSKMRPPPKSRRL